jgi:hypothetical protein
VTCGACDGGGEQVVWFEYAESRRTVVAFDQDSPTLLAHRHLREDRFLGPGDLERFTPFVTVQEHGPLDPASLEREDADALWRIAPQIDARLERVSAQQLLKFGVVRRDVRYEMCGTVGTLALSGANLLGASTPAALKPIRRRWLILALSAAAFAVLANGWRLLFSGPTAYFDPTNARVSVLAVVSVATALLATAGVLRRWRPRFKWWRSLRSEQAAVTALVASFIAAPVVAYLGRPTVAEARAALNAGHLDRAGVVVEAMLATRPSAEANDVADQWGLACADRLAGDARIERLDDVATHGGPRSGEARARALHARIEAVTAALAAGRADDALSRLDRWAAALQGEAEVAELRASAEDAKAAACKDATCRFVASRSAVAAHSTTLRSEALAAARQQVLAALEPREAADPDPLTRIRALRAAAAVGAAVLTSGPDPELSEKATAVTGLVEAELSKVVLLGAPAALVDEVLGRPRAGSPLSGWRGLDGVAVYVAAAAGRCTGLYVVGASNGARSLAGKEPGLRRLLSQATGRPSKGIQPRPKSAKDHATSRWAEGPTQVLARWNGDALMELRVGDATP